MPGRLQSRAGLLEAVLSGRTIGGRRDALNA